MRITGVSIENYKSIKSARNNEIHKKINILAGKNNTGKTAFIEAIFKTFNANLVSNLADNNSEIATLEIDVFLNSNDLKVLNLNVGEYGIKNYSHFRLEVKYRGETTAIHSIKVLHKKDYITVFELNDKESSNYRIKNLTTGGSVSFSGAIPRFIVNFFEYLKKNIIFISGSRHVPNFDEAKLDGNLNVEGTNLNAFLYTLRNNNEETFDEIKNTFIKIFNDVDSIRTPIDDLGKTSISLKFKGDDKLFELSNCGSGYSHVLLFLCVLYSKTSQIVLFDEPQAFLHPSAEKAIYDLIAEEGEQQYFLTTHSPILINYPFDKNIIYVKRVENESRYTKLNQIQDVLSDIGVRNSDFALAEKIIFVEGPTEEKVLPKILKAFGVKQLGYNYKIISMNGTSNEFSKKTAMTRNKEKLDYILGHISYSPIPYRILIDSDDKDETKISEIKEKYGENVVILDKKEIENYFLECYQEISEVIEIESSNEVSVESVKQKIGELLDDIGDPKLYPRKSDDKIKNVVGSEVLERLFESYGISYDKINHGVKLIDRVLKNNSEQFLFFKESLVDFVKG